MRQSSMKNLEPYPSVSGSYGSPAGWQASRLAGQQSDEILVDSKFSTDCTVRILTMSKEHCYHGFTKAFRWVFRVRCIVTHL